MRNLIPEFILEKQNTEDFSGSMTAAVLFIDISGFTDMTSSLMQNGKEGAEVVSAVINNIFTPAIALIQQHGGFIATFAGDAFTAVFPAHIVERELLSATTAALGIIKAFQEFGRQDTRFGIYQLSVKTGLALGSVNWQIISTANQSAYYFQGEAIDRAAECEHYATIFDLITDEKVKINLFKHAEFTPKSEGFYKLTDFYDYADIKPKVNIQLDLDKICNFVPEVICQMRSRGEFRDIISCFISFEVSADLIAQLTRVMDLCIAYGGYFNKIDFGDKGGVILILFGAPLAREKIFIRSADFMLEVLAIKEFVCRAGLTFGTAFTGFVGSIEREEYTALGETVNLSARLMMHAPSRGIFLDSRMAAECEKEYRINNLGNFKFKGFSTELPVFSLIGKKADNSSQIDNYEQNIIGRTRELSEIRQKIDEFISNKTPATIIVEGLAGIGKSRIVQAVRHEYFAKKDSKINWIILPCDEILKKSFNPLIHYLKDFFQIDDMNSKEKIAQDFDIFFNKFLLDIKTSFRSDLFNSRDFLAALLDISSPESLYAQLDAKDRLEQTKQALTCFFSALSTVKPIVMQIEDAHWLDAETAAWLQRFFKQISVPILLVATSRLNDDGSSLNLFAGYPAKTSIILNGFQDHELKQMILYRIKSYNLILKTIPADLFTFIKEKSEGNPFFCDQILLYLTENKLLDKNGMLIKTTDAIPSSISSIILARVDRLATEVRETIKTASVLGREFSVEILTAMLKNITVSDTLKSGEQEVIWNHLSEIKYIFHHALIRESIYEMQLKEQLRKLHNLAAEAIENLYQDKLETCYHDLADHYLKAENTDQSCKYLMLAAKDAEVKYQNRVALELYSKLLNVLENSNQTDQDTYLYALIHSGTINYMTGEVIVAEKFHKKAIETAQSNKNLLRLSEAKRYLGNIHLDRGELQEAFDLYEECEKISKSIGDFEGLAFALSNIGKIYWMINDSKALEYYKKRLKIMEDLKNEKEIARSLYLIATYYQTFENSSLALKYYKQAIALAKSCKILSIELNSIGNMGLIYYNLQNYSLAKKCFNNQAKFSIKTGNKLTEANATGNIGLIHYDLADFKKALKYFNHKYSIVTKLNNIKEIIITSGNIGDIYFEIGNYSEAEKYYNDQLNLSIQSKDKRNEADACGNLGNLQMVIGNYSKALLFLKNKLSVGKKIKNYEQIFGGLNALSLVCISLEKFNIANEYMNRALKAATKWKSTSDINLSFYNISEILLKQNLFDLAIENLNKVKSISFDPKFEAMLSKCFADAYTGLNQYDLAKENYIKAADLARKIGVKYYLTTILNNHAALHLKTNEIDEAIILNLEALSIAKEIKVPDDIFAAEFLQAKITAAKNKENAIDLLKDISSRYPEIKEQSRIIWLMAKLTRDEKLNKKAVKLLNRQIKKTDNPEYAEMLKEIE